MNKKRDGHIHSPWCPHGTSDPLEAYAQKAMEQGLDEISFTEHMPFPCYFLEDHAYQDDCAPLQAVMGDYFAGVAAIREEYRGRLRIHCGLEVDYLDGLERQTAALLGEYGPRLDDGLLSVHFVRIGETYYDIDSLDGFAEVRSILGSTEAVYEKYYQTLLQAVRAELGPYKPCRVGHPNLIRIFHQKFPVENSDSPLFDTLAREIKQRGMALDFNTAGLRKPLCGEPYVFGTFRTLAEQYAIPMVFGSDAHTASDVGRDF